MSFVFGVVRNLHVTIMMIESHAWNCLKPVVQWGQSISRPICFFHAFSIHLFGFVSVNCESVRNIIYNLIYVHSNTIVDTYVYVCIISTIMVVTSTFYYIYIYLFVHTMVVFFKRHIWHISCGQPPFWGELWMDVIPKTPAKPALKAFELHLLTESGECQEMGRWGER